MFYKYIQHCPVCFKSCTTESYTVPPVLIKLYTVLLRNSVIDGAVRKNEMNLDNLIQQGTNGLGYCTTFRIIQSNPEWEIMRLFPCLRCMNVTNLNFARILTMILQVTILLCCLSAVKGTTFNVTLTQIELARYDLK